MLSRFGIVVIALAVGLGGMSALSALRAFAGSRVETYASEFHDIAIGCSEYYAASDCVRCHGINPHRYEAGVPLALAPEAPNCTKCHPMSLWSDIIDAQRPLSMFPPSMETR